MENNKLEKIIFILLRVLGILSILGAFLSNDAFYSKEPLLLFGGKSIIGNIYGISPVAIASMAVSITLYLLFIRFLAKHLHITKKN